MEWIYNLLAQVDAWVATVVKRLSHQEMRRGLPLKLYDGPQGLMQELAAAQLNAYVLVVVLYWEASEMVSETDGEVTHVVGDPPTMGRYLAVRYR